MVGQRESIRRQVFSWTKVRSFALAAMHNQQLVATPAQVLNDGPANQASPAENSDTHSTQSARAQ
jgi:hypothetical protein